MRLGGFEEGASTTSVNIGMGIDAIGGDGEVDGDRLGVLRGGILEN